MDMITLEITLIISITMLALLTIVITMSNKETAGFNEWRLSSILFALAFLFVPFLNKSIQFVPFIFFFYLIFLAFYLQSEAAFFLVTHEQPKGVKYIALNSLLFLSLLIGITVITKNQTPASLLLSLFTAIFFIRHSFLIAKVNTRKKSNCYNAKRLLGLFLLVAGSFHLLRIVILLIMIKSFKDFSPFTYSRWSHYSFITILVYLLFYFTLMFCTFSRIRNHQISLEQEKLRYLFTFLNSTAPYLEINQLYTKIRTILVKTLGIDSGGIYLINQDGLSHSMVFSLDEIGAISHDMLFFQNDQGLSGQAISTGSFVETDMEDYPVAKTAARMKSLGIEYMAAVPIRIPSQVIGAITIACRNWKKHEMMDQELLTYLGEQLGIVLHNALLYQKLKSMAHTDPLTGLLNRRKIMEHLDELIKRYRRNKTPFCIAIGDLDHFKKVNDNYGHEAGDVILQEAAHIFEFSCREIDFIGRWGGEEFIFIFMETGIDAALRIAERIKNKIEHYECRHNDNTISITISLGITEFRDADTASTVIARADKALYCSKDKGRNTINQN